MINNTFIKQIERSRDTISSSSSSGISAGGFAGQILKKASNLDYDTVWTDQVDVSLLYPRSNPSGYITNDNLSGFITGVENVVYTFGDQNISGRKSFFDGIDVGLQNDITTLYVGSGVVGINNENPQAALDVSGSVLFNQRPTVNGSGVLLIGELGQQINQKKIVTKLIKLNLIQRKLIQLHLVSKIT